MKFYNLYRFRQYGQILGISSKARPGNDMFRAIKKHSTVDNTLTELVNQVNAAPCNFSATYYSK